MSPTKSRTHLSLACAALSVSALAAPVRADGGGADDDRGLSLALASGGHLFADDLELGVADAPDQGSPASGLLIGARVGWRFTRRLGVEGELVVIPTSDRMTSESLDVVGFRAQLAVDIVRAGRMRPFLVAGLGGLDLVASDAPGIERDADLALHWGAGLGVALSPALELRFDGRHLVVPNIDHSGGSSDFEWSASLAYTFRPARSAPAAPAIRRPPPAPAPAPPAATDLDRDGLTDSVDDCPRAPETQNGYEDDDGCPDQILVELSGIHFETGSARIAADSATVLERAVEILTRHPDLAVEISGHTSEEGTYLRNVQLSLQRANAVRDYLTGRGVDAGRMRTVGYGPDRPIADNTTAEGRIKNRRIEFRIVTGR
jgi:outer membrane protein OmpA-like peptidoglycan-associated protein